MPKLTSNFCPSITGVIGTTSPRFNFPSKPTFNLFTFTLLISISSPSGSKSLTLAFKISVSLGFVTSTTHVISFASLVEFGVPLLAIDSTILVGLPIIVIVLSLLSLNSISSTTSSLNFSSLNLAPKPKVPFVTSPTFSISSLNTNLSLLLMILCLPTISPPLSTISLFSKVAPSLKASGISISA